MAGNFARGLIQFLIELRKSHINSEVISRKFLFKKLNGVGNKKNGLKMKLKLGETFEETKGRDDKVY